MGIVITVIFIVLLNYGPLEGHLNMDGVLLVYFGLLALLYLIVSYLAYFNECPRCGGEVIQEPDPCNPKGKRVRCSHCGWIW